VTSLSEQALAERLPSLIDVSLSVVNRRLPLAVQPGTSLAECLRAIQRSGFGDSVLVVGADGHLRGVLTERDIFARLIGTGAELDEPVESQMNTEPHTLLPDQTVRAAIELMQTGRYRNIPIVDRAGRLDGIVRQQDILRFLAESFPEALLNLPPRPHQALQGSEGA
jgi:CBS domain-containing protein